MPIYAYKCSACGFAKDVLQKLSDAPLTECLQCGASAFSKQVTAAGFQLKGSGWYVTDFRDGGGKKAAEKGNADKGDADKGKSAPADGAPASAGAADAPAAASPAAAPAPAPAAAPAAKGD
ncbi:putative regulatory protein, FmdB family [Variovorax sp. PBS-H4]|uniref:FmdB family zinc ribbon protein n=1 Tax=Variovorax sp. PBS-H4 TaxID=434008 RepID=UPI00131678A8|nr:FmdB family zinc ribbon protein [Variovorax sp. PBS-H4]VTU24674.1 putative regulatory protein, FmdB family [Variovorax sp. PBS-H4]